MLSALYSHTRGLNPWAFTISPPITRSKFAHDVRKKSRPSCGGVDWNIPLLFALCSMLLPPPLRPPYDLESLLEFERFTGVVHNLLFHFVNDAFYDILYSNDIYLVRVILIDSFLKKYIEHSMLLIGSYFSRHRSIIFSDRINPPSLKQQLWRGKQD